MATIDVGFVLSIRALNIPLRCWPWECVSRLSAGGTHTKCFLSEVIRVCAGILFGTEAAW